MRERLGDRGIMVLRSVTMRADAPEETFPFTVPVIRALRERTLEFRAPVTFLVGENGSGKSTLLEAIACAAGSIAVGAQSVDRDPTLVAARELAGWLRLVWTRRKRQGFFLRAEDFFGYVKALDELDQANAAELRAVYSGKRDPEALPEFAEREWQGGGREGYDRQSHGEAFLALFQQRVRGEGLYLLDEPEAPLSPQRQLALLAMVIAAADRGAQFVIATHSPILMAVPDAVIYAFDDGVPMETSWDDLEHVRLTRDFLNAPERYLRHLRGDA